MQLYGKKLIRGRIKSLQEEQIESRDAIVWDILADERICRVKIQGSNEYILAHYPQNWEATPFWLKPGNAVRIVHRAGTRGFIEVAGHGRAVPTPVTGGTFPTVATPPDGVLTGCHLSQSWNNPKMLVLVTTGTFRIGGVIYTLDAMPMLYGDAYYMGDGGAMSNVAGAMPINAAPGAGLARYDLICVGMNAVIDYVAGTAAADPDEPAVPASHIKLGDFIYVPHGTTQITQPLIGATHSTPTPTKLVVTVDDSDLAWAETSTGIRVDVYDQNGNLLVGTGDGFYITLEFSAGNGALASDEEGSSATKIGQHTGTANHAHFTYTRGGSDPGDLSPAILITLEAEAPIYNSAVVVVRDSDGNPM